MLRAADTVGVFQVESRAQMATLPRMQPERFYDLVVEVAIIRPGPIVGKMVNPYLRAPAAGGSWSRYPHPSLEPILKRTLGVPLFQEQLIRMAMTAAGFTGGQAEELRRAMGFKRSQERMKEIERDLRAGMTRNGIRRPAQEEIVPGIKSFALYGFPESHAASFALIAYASAYLKAHHGAAFLCALLNNWPMGFYHPATLVTDAGRHGIQHPAHRRAGLALAVHPGAGRRTAALCGAPGAASRCAGCARAIGRQIARRRRCGRSPRWPTSTRGSPASEAERATLAEVGALRAAGRHAAAGDVAGGGAGAVGRAVRSRRERRRRRRPAAPRRCRR